MSKEVGGSGIGKIFLNVSLQRTVVEPDDRGFNPKTR
jgi:hypothetical protein